MSGFGCRQTMKQVVSIAEDLNQHVLEFMEKDIDRNTKDEQQKLSQFKTYLWKKFFLNHPIESKGEVE